VLEDILRLTDLELDHLADALFQGAIGPGSGTQQIRMAGLGPAAEQIEPWLREAAEHFGTAAGVAAAVRLLRAERRRADGQGPRPDLIITGPDLGGLGGRDTRVVVREAFESARRSVLIVGYAFYGSELIFAPLAERMIASPDLSVRIVVNVHPERGRSAEDTIRRFTESFLRSSWPFSPRPGIYYAPGSLGEPGPELARVHARLTIVDGLDVILGSVNFTTAAFHRNLEVGVRIRSRELCESLTLYFNLLVDQGSLRPLLMP